MNSGHVSDFIFDMLERLEGRPPSKPQEPAQPASSNGHREAAMADYPLDSLGVQIKAH